MNKYTVSCLGRDCPGLVAVITRLFGEANCNIEAMSQTMLCGEFASVFVVEAPAGMLLADLRVFILDGLKKNNVDLSILVRHSTGKAWGDDIVCDPFVVTVDGPDKPGLIGAMSRVFARHDVNIENMHAMLGEDKAGAALFVFEIMIPAGVDIGRLGRELASEAHKLGLRVSMQHRDIFEAVHRVRNF